jgi:hypothetical protein
MTKDEATLYIAELLILDTQSKIQECIIAVHRQEE